MSIKTPLLLFMVMWISMFTIGSEDSPLFSPLFPVERELFFNLMRELGSGEQTEQEIQDSRRVHARIHSLLTDYSQLFAEIREQSSSTQQEIDVQFFCQRVQDDPCLTKLVKDLMMVLCDEREFLVSFLTTYHKVEKGYCTSDEYQVALQSYLPKNIDVVQFSFEHFVWGFRYLYRTFEDKRVLTMHDIHFVLQRTSSYFDLPKKSQDLWERLMFVVKNDMKEVAREVHYYVLCNAKEVVKDPNFYLVYKILRSLAKFRREGLKTRGTEYEHLVDCSGMIHKMIAAIRSVERINTLNGTITAAGALELLIFEKQ